MTTPPVYNRKNPCLARLARMELLTKAGSEKDTRHFEIDLADSGLVYEPGDSLAILPQNDPALVEEIIAHLGATGEESVFNADKVETTLRSALLKDCVITTVDNKLIRTLAERASAPELAALLEPDRKKDLADFLWGREVIDLLLAYPQVRFQPVELVPLLKKLQVRLYSISSSLRAFPREVHLTVATVEYESRGRRRKGVASTWLAQRIDHDTPIPCFINPGKGFRLPAPEDETPVLMIGPGTGIAPFRAFVQERRCTGARGRAWLFFGEQRRANDFFYEQEWQQALADGSLTRFSTAFSRDQSEKFYVQHAMKLAAADIWAWLEEGAIIYVCGDANRMAADVDRALQDIIASQGNRPAEAAADYLEALRQAKRYRRDVY
ncbi:MAG: sulfite reductase subunit alpha [Verrucomicrobiales bacterium]